MTRGSAFGFSYTDTTRACTAYASAAGTESRVSAQTERLSSFPMTVKLEATNNIPSSRSNEIQIVGLVTARSVCNKVMGTRYLGTYGNETARKTDA